MSSGKWHSTLLKPIICIAFVAVLSKVAQAAAGILVAHRFGAGSVTDAYLLAKSVPIGVYLICDSLLYNSLVPMLKRGEGTAKKHGPFFGVVSIGSMLLAILATALLVLFAPFIYGILAPGSAQETTALAATLSRLTSLAILAAVPSSLFKAVNVCNKRYILASLDALVMHTVLISAILLSPTRWGVWPAAAALPAACLALLMIQAGLARSTFHPEKPDWRSAQAGEWMHLLMPLALINCLLQINMLSMNALASFCDPGAISCLNYSYAICQVPVAMIDLLLMSALFPFASQLSFQGDMRTFGQAYAALCKIILLMLVPAAVWFILERHTIVQALLEHGVFDGTDTMLTAKCMIGHGIAITFWALEALSYRCLYALKLHKKYVKALLVRILLNIGLAVFLLQRFGPLGVSMAFAFSMALGAFLNNRTIMKRLDGDATRRIRKSQVFAAAMVACSTSAVYVLHMINMGAAFSPPMRLAMGATISVAAVLLVYTLGFRILSRDVLQRLWRRL